MFGFLQSTRRLVDKPRYDGLYRHASRWRSTSRGSQTLDVIKIDQIAECEADLTVSIGLKFQAEAGSPAGNNRVATRFASSSRSVNRH